MDIINRIISRLHGSNGKPTIEMSEDMREYFLGSVEKWKDVYNGGGSWRYTRKGGIDGGYRRVHSLGSAKALCMELAALCFSQQMDIAYSDKQVQALVEKTLQDNDFWTCFPLFLEKMFAYGGGVIKTYTQDGDVKLDFIAADCFIPTQYDEKGVYGGVAVSASYSDNTRYLLLERHEKTADGYVITNKLFKKRDKDGSFNETALCELYPELEPVVEVEGLKKPLFVYFRTAVAGESDAALGTSVFASCIDTLESLDVIFDSLQREFVLGKKRIIVPVSALRGTYDSDGKLKKYFDTDDEVYQAFSADDKDELKIFDNSGELRVTEHIDALTQLLDLLCMQVGLSAGSLSYHSGTMKTATEVMSQNDKTHRTKTAHQQLIREGIIAVLDNIVLLSVLMGKLPETAVNLEPSIVFSDSVSHDNASKIDNTLRLYNAGLIDKTAAIAEIYGLGTLEAEQKGN